MVQNSGEAWDEQTVHTKPDNKISKAFEAFSEALKEKNVHPRLWRTAMVVGVAPVAEACKVRG